MSKIENPTVRFVLTLVKYVITYLLGLGTDSVLSSVLGV